MHACMTHILYNIMDINVQFCYGNCPVLLTIADEENFTHQVKFRHRDPHLHAASKKYMMNNSTCNQFCEWWQFICAYLPSCHL